MGAFWDYLTSSSPITWIVLLWLSIYFIFTFWIFIDRYILLQKRIDVETISLKNIYRGADSTVSNNSLLGPYINRSDRISKALLDAAISDALRYATKGLTWLSIIASTSPFVGLFGTVVGILETFSRLSAASTATLGMVAPSISEALIATAAGILVAIFAYTFHLMLKRKAYELSSLLESEADILLSQSGA